MSTLPELVRRAAQASPGKTALVFREQRQSWAELDEAVDQAAQALLALGLERGDRVALALGNTLDFPTAYFGALRAGLVALPVNTAYTPRELAHVLGDSGARALVTHRGGAAQAVELLPGLPALEHVLVAGAGPAPDGARLLAELESPELELPAGAAEELAVLIYTSGTSGRPKGAMLTHGALLANLEQSARIQPPVVSADDVLLLVLPLFHIYGLNPGLGSVAFHGATGVLVERFDPVDTLEDVRQHHVTNIVGAPPMYVAWSMLPDVGAAFESVRLALSGAAPLPADALGRLLETTGRHVFEGYGLTETAPVVTTTLMSEVAKPGSIGKPIPGIEVKLVDEDGQEVDEDDPGELVVRGPNLFSGYWPDASGGPDAEGWFATGDVAYADDDGDLFLVDRRKELILVSGFNVYPREVEDVLDSHPDIEESAVIGIAHPYTGESVKALVVLRDGAHLSADEVVEHCSRSLARFKCPSAVDFVQELPHSATGKVRKGELRDAATGAGRSD